MSSTDELLIVVDGKLQPITQAMIRKDAFYKGIKGRYTRSQAIEKTIKHHLYKYFEKEINLADYGTEDPPKWYISASDEGDVLDDICELQSVAIARKHGLIGPRYAPGLWRPSILRERFNIPLEHPKSCMSLFTLRDEDVDKLYDEAVSRIAAANVK